MAFSTVGTPDYIAPEVLLKKGYGLECDWLNNQCQLDPDPSERCFLLKISVLLAIHIGILQLSKGSVILLKREACHHDHQSTLHTVIL
ncbi:putative non-specific serine/threonine protein kinase [Medicago truncatula]|uniref:Putative non-specific serine/threonine protein kinase n=1 Tax=Medicago truncatula TaxID=3880 RepID=A0A396JAT5_MEDTR|nr:putative non-specific serine/threonine protein kinase [Medicago truncatula]